MIISGKKIVLIENVMMRQALALSDLAEREQKGEITKSQMTLETLKVFIVSIDGITDKKTIEDILLDQIKAEDMSDLTEEVAKISEGIAKKKTH